VLAALCFFLFLGLAFVYRHALGKGYPKGYDEGYIVGVNDGKDFIRRS
jgi:hypothetical protein